MVSWTSTLIHANTPPTTTKIQGRLRRLTAFVSLFPRERIHEYPDAEEWMAARQKACKSGFTAGHDPVNPRENNHSQYGRVKSFNPVVLPPECYKSSWTDAEFALM